MRGISGKFIGLGVGLLFFVVLLLIPLPAGMSEEARRTAAITLLVAVWWITEAIPIPATSLLPFLLFPILGVIPSGDVSRLYYDQNIFLFMGGFFIAIAMEKWNLHKRVALRVVKTTGTNPVMLVLGFLCASTFLSMWISNTATTLMLLPIGLAVIGRLTGEVPGEEPAAAPSAPAITMLLAIAYGASLGGIATPIGTPPNIIFIGQFGKLFPSAPPITFADWIKVFLPLTAVFVPIAWLLLTKVTAKVGSEKNASDTRGLIEDELRKLGRFSPGEKIVFVLFVSTALLWIFSKPIELGFFTLPGWHALLPEKITGYIHDSTVAVFIALLMFILPVPKRGGERVLSWADARKIPWGVLLLFGAGFAIADAFQKSGLSAYLGSLLTALASVPPFVMVLLICLLITFLTEITSNTATAAVMLPIIASLSLTIGVNPLLLMLPATISASFAFMLPVATPPNAVVFGSGLVPIRKMVIAGLYMNLIGAALIAAVIYLVAIYVWDIDPSALPDWAR